MSILPSNLVRRLSLVVTEKEKHQRQTLRSITGQCIDVVGLSQIRVQIGTFKAHYEFRVAAVDTGPVLGADFLSSHRMTVTLNQNRLSWGTGSTDMCVRSLALSRTSKLYIVLTEDVELATAREVDQDDK